LLISILVLLIVGINFHHIQTQPNFVKSDQYYATNDATTTSADELMPIWVKIKPKNREDLNFRPQTLTATVEVQKETATQIDLVADTKATALILNHVYFPGWKAYVDKKEVSLEALDQIGLMSLVLPFGRHEVRFSFERTPVRIVADLLSLLGISGLLLYLWKNSSKLQS
jgi:uncharacterized membrane protein YfhO